MNFELQPHLENNLIRIQPLQESDFEGLYAVAADPLLWEQHPNPDRYRRDVFQTFFKGAMESGGAFLAFDAKTNQPIGSSRYSDLNEAARTVCIGYTFIARSHWGGKYNPALKTLMLDHAFRFVDAVIFKIGACNIRSQTAIERLGARKTGEALIEYFGEAGKPNFIYEIKKKEWEKNRLRLRSA
ncbi:MAG TPA: GNAT family N-acetyltransferase [Bacteroidia bacterium]|jgi:RimJ/RimL family protein N-acetyltransferase|nr:GNAT family N-acetyltransferase [Bacteroidia bacterium]